MSRYRKLGLWLAACLASAQTTIAHAQDPDRSAAVHGFVREAQTGEPIPSTTITVEGHRSVATDRSGYFTVSVAAGEHRIRVRAMGYAPLDTTTAGSSEPLELRLRPAPLELATVQVEAEPAEARRFEDAEVSVQTVTPAQIRRVPAALEADLFRSIQALPGVIAPSAYSGRLLVRGGAADQNLFLLDGYPVLHPYHLAGGFSAFHVDAVQDAEMWIAVPPARYGGHLSSVLDVALREGNRERTTGTASVGLISSAAVVEGPHRRGAWFAGLRTTYLDLLTRALGGELPYRFYDGYAKAYADLTPSDRLSGLVFLGRDATWRAQSRGDHFEWSNSVYGMSWRHLFSGKAVFEQRASWSRFSAQLDSGYSRLQGANVVTDHQIDLVTLRGDLRLHALPRHLIEVGYSLDSRWSDHWVGYLTGLPRSLRAQRSGVSARRTATLYAQDDVAWSDAFRMRIGLRGELGAESRSLQPRISGKYLLTSRLALTAGAGLLRQQDQLLQDPDSNFDLYTADIWLTSGEADVPEARSSHVVVGMEALLPYDVRLRAETYRKRSNGLVILAPFDPERRRFAIERLEVAEGLDRGLDISLMRDAGAVRGWVGYSLATSLRTVHDSVFPAEPHPQQRFVAVGDSKLRRWSFTGRFEAFAGIPFTPAVEMVPERPYDFGLGRFTDQCAATDVEYLYGGRNSARTGWSKRLDLGAARQWTDRRGRTWAVTLSLLNALFDPTGVFRPAPADRRSGCDAPAPVLRESELVLPPIPSIGLRVEF